MKNLALALAFERIASMLEVLGESPFKIRAYRRVARTLLELAEPIEQVAAEGRLRQLPGVGEAIAAKIEQYLSTGTIELLERLREQLPEGVVQLMEVPGVGPRTARLLYDTLGVRSIEQLEALARQGRLRGTKGLGTRTEQAILEGIERWKRRAGRLPLAQLLAAGEELAAMLQRSDGVRRVSLAGSARRAEEMGRDADLVVGADSVDRVAQLLAGVGSPQGGPWPGTLRIQGAGPGGTPVDVWIVPDELFATSCVEATGPAAHVEALVRRLEKRGWRWEGGRLVGEDGMEYAVAEEAQVYRLAGLPWVAPELRWGEDELTLAERGELPARLVELSDIRGDLHTHTSESDGTATAREMAEAAMARGLSYLAITDHSPSLTVARGLTPDRLEAQLRIIEALNREFAADRGRSGGLVVLSGSEVDILPDGRLDYPDEVLARLQVVVASVHSRFQMDEAAMTARLLAACESPWVHVLGHPSGRLLGRRDPYPVDLETVLRRAAETGTAVEINASPDRLDLSAQWARRARRMGVRLVISTDAHSTGQLAFLRYGVLVARRAGLGPEDILNTLPLDQLLPSLKGN